LHRGGCNCGWLVAGNVEIHDVVELTLKEKRIGECDYAENWKE